MRERVYDGQVLRGAHVPDVLGIQAAAHYSMTAVCSMCYVDTAMHMWLLCTAAIPLPWPSRRVSVCYNGKSHTWTLGLTQQNISDSSDGLSVHW
jgi:hypothetical protein